MCKLQRLLVALLAVALLVSCSTKKNTAGARFYHSFASRFNILYNGQVAYAEGLEQQQRGNQDDYTRLLPMDIVQNKSTAQLGKGSYETAITKCEKAIKLHSIKKRPISKAGRKRTEKEKLFLQRKEFNPYLRHAWMMMGRSQYNMGEFVEAASTFNYIQRLYATQPEVSALATAWLARCYVGMGWPYDAETLLDKTKRDSLTDEARRERDATTAAFLIETQQYKEAMPYLRSSIKHAKGKLQRARLNFLAGQLETQLGNTEAAYKHFQRVIRSNPPYELSFNARIQQSEVMSATKGGSVIKKLQRMARSDKNKDYLDQLYYAIGNIYLAQGDTLRCIGAYEKGAEESTRNGSAKAQVLLRLSQLYWERENYIDAARTYQGCVAILDKEHDLFKQSEERSKMLAQAEPHLSAVKLQDSLQQLAVMPEPQRLEAIDRVIEALKKKEKEEAKKNGQQAMQPANTSVAQPGQNAQAGIQRGQKGAWYFYNPTTLSRGAQEFQRKWGRRPNEDNWRWSNREGLESNGEEQDEGYDYDEQTDSIGGEDVATVDDEQALQDSLANDPHHREYYLAQIPFTEEQKELSNQLLSDGLYNGGLIVMRDIGNLPYAQRMLERLVSKFPNLDAATRADALYHLFLLYGHMGQGELAEQYRQQLVSEYPEDERALLVNNPLYEQIAREGKHLEDTTYQRAYAAYEASDYATVAQQYDFHTQNFPQGAHRARMMLVQAMSLLYEGHKQEFMTMLEQLIKEFGKDEVAQMANEIVKGLKDGRLLSDSKYGQSDIWKRRRMDNAFGDTLKADTLSADRYTTYSFVLAYPTGGLDEDQLLYELARYNFSSYMVRNFEIEILDSEGLSMMCVRGFLSYDEVHAYAQRLYADPHMFRRLEGIRAMLISDENLQKIGQGVSVDDYEDFYQKYLSTLPLPENTVLDEPTDIEFIDPDNVEPGTEEETAEGEVVVDDFPFGW